MFHEEVSEVLNYQISDIEFQEYQKLSLTDDFMFRHCMPYKEILKPLLEELWNKEIGEILEVHQNHCIEPTSEHSYILCDIYVRDSQNDVYILEMQKWPQKELRKRSKCYQTVSIFDRYTKDIKGRERIQYEAVAECYIAFLCCFDVSRIFPSMRFPILEEIPKTVYRSDSMLFVNIKNHSRIESERLRELFKFILDSDTSLHASWGVIQSLQRKVEATRRDMDMAVRYYVDERRYHEHFLDGRDVGRDEGIQLGKMDMIQRMYERNIPVEVISSIASISVSEIQEIIDQKQCG